MHDGLKIMIGAGASALLAWGLHGPLGQGKAFVAGLQTQADSALAARGVSGVQVRYPDDPYARTAQLSGNVDLMTQSDAISVLRTLDGGAGAMWQAKPVAGAPEAPATPSNAAENAVAPVVSVKPTPTPVAKPAPLPTVKPSPVAKPAPLPAPKPATSPLPKPSPAPAAAPLAANSCQRVVDAALAGRVMSFRSGSAWLNPQSTKIIADVAAALKRCRTAAIEIGGHTDGSGDEGVNRAMSQERANRVRDALVARGVPAAAVSARGYGSARPLRAGNPLDQANRRIGFTVTRGGA